MFKRVLYVSTFFLLTTGISFSAPGDFDTTFGGTGVVTYNTDIGTDHWDYGRGVAIQQDGKIVVTGSIPSPDGLGYDAVVLRYNSDGTLDSTFGGDGIVTYDNYYHTDDGGESVAIQPDGKIVVVGWTPFGGHKRVLVLRYNEDGSLDTSFSEDGVAIYSGLGDGDDVGHAVAIQQDGKIVVVGHGYNNTSNDDVLILRYESNGTLDTTFGEDGVVTYNGIVNGNEAGYGVAIQQDGKIVVVGVSYNGYTDQHYEDILVLRYESNGTLDTTFNGTGVASYDSGTGGYNYDYGYGVAIQQDEKIVVTGYSYDGSNRSAVILRYSSDGTLDVTFSKDGVAIYDIPANPGFAGFRVAMQADGKIVVSGGGGWNGNNSDIVFLRYNSDGILDSSFGENGVLLYNGVANGDEVGNAVAIQPDGKIVVVGHGWNGSNNVDILVLRCNSDGTFDKTFGSSGTVTYGSSSYGDHDDYGYAVATQPDGKIIIIGNNGDVLILRYNSDGSLDKTFGINGIVTTRGFMRNDYGYAGVVQPDGKIVIAGGSWNGHNWDVLVMRFNGDGTPDISFGSYGVVVYDSGLDEESYGIALQQNGKIVVVGYKFNFGLQMYDALIVRYNSDGTLDKTFGEGGITIYNSRSDGLDFGSAVALQPDGKIVVTGYSNTAPSIYEAFVLRYNSNGSLDSTFGVDGVVIYNNFYQDFGYGVAIQPNAKIVVVGEEYGDSLVLRYNSDGSLDRSFARDGSVTFDSGGYDYSSAVAIQSQGEIVVTGSSNGNTLILRYKNDGSLDSTFGGDGVIFYEGGVNGSGIAVQPDDKIVVTGSSWNYGNNTYDILTLRLLVDSDRTPPIPNPMTWEAVPHQTGSNSISMVASTATDPTPPISYYFDFVDSPTGGLGGAASGWQSETSYTNSNLQANHKYGYRVKAKDGVNNQTAYSTTQYAYTLANVPGLHSFTNVTKDCIRANWGAKGNSSGTEYLCENTTAKSSSGWITDTFWDSCNLSCSTTYSFRVKARNSDGKETDWVSLGSQWTQSCYTGLTILLQSPTYGATFNSCSLMPTYQPTFSWTSTETFAKYAIVFFTIPGVPKTLRIPIMETIVPGNKNSWTPPIETWKKILMATHSRIVIRDIYWKVIGIRPLGSTISSDVGSFRIAKPQPVMIDTPLEGVTLPYTSPPTFNFNSNCNIKFKLEFSSLKDFSDPKKMKGFIFTTNDPNVETVMNRTLTPMEWISVRQLIGTKTAYFRIKAWDTINRETVSDVMSFSVESSLVGTWDVKGTQTVTVILQGYGTESRTLQFYDEFAFNLDGTFQMTSMSGTWTEDGSALTVSLPYDAVELYLEQAFRNQGLDVDITVTSVVFTGKENWINDTISGKIIMAMKIYIYNYGLPGTARATATFTGTRQEETPIATLEEDLSKRSKSLVETIGTKFNETIRLLNISPVR